MIGGSFVRGVSGGERKRVSIGNEIIINPSLLFLDEPTSGLDSTTALRIIDTLYDIAKVQMLTLMMSVVLLPEMPVKSIYLNEHCALYRKMTMNNMLPWCSICQIHGGRLVKQWSRQSTSHRADSSSSSTS